MGHIECPLAERKGFEPLEEFTLSGFQDHRTRPLCDLSRWIFMGNTDILYHLYWEKANEIKTGRALDFGLFSSNFCFLSVLSFRGIELRTNRSPLSQNDHRNLLV